MFPLTVQTYWPVGQSSTRWPRITSVKVAEVEELLFANFRTELARSEVIEAVRLSVPGSSPVTAEEYSTAKRRAWNTASADTKRQVGPSDWAAYRSALGRGVIREVPLLLDEETMTAWLPASKRRRRRVA